MLRHGQTDFNLRGIVQGSGVDSSLNETGLRQARSFFDAYHDYGFDKVLTSALKRTKETIQRFIDEGIPVESLKELNEISWGKHEGQPITPEEDKYYHWMLRQWQLGDTSHRIDGGESPDEVAARLKRALEKIIQSSSNRILVCMHGRAIRIMLCLMLNYPLKSMDMFEHQNTGIYELQLTGTMFHILKYNDGEHLKKIAQLTVGR